MNQTIDASTLIDLNETPEKLRGMKMNDLASITNNANGQKLLVVFQCYASYDPKAIETEGLKGFNMDNHIWLTTYSSRGLEMERNGEEVNLNNSYHLLYHHVRGGNEKAAMPVSDMIELIKSGEYTIC